MSYLTETATLEYDTSGNNGNYEYHLPHTKTIDLIGEEWGGTLSPAVIAGIAVTCLSVVGAGAYAAWYNWTNEEDGILRRIAAYFSHEDSIWERMFDCFHHEESFMDKVKKTFGYKED